MISYIGDISKADATVLFYHARRHVNILEFGCGASTQVLAAYCGISSLTSIDTDQGWIQKTMDNLKLLEIDKEVHFESYSSFMQGIQNTTLNRGYDFIFVDGIDALRREFAIKLWPHLKVGGTMAFHDTRRAHDFRNVLEVLAQFQNEIGIVDFNAGHSNITLVEKKKAEPYENWQITEDKKPWMLGYGDVPPEEVDKIKSLLKPEQNGN